MIDSARLQQAYETAREALLGTRVPAGHWVGELSSSALSTATATSALSLVAKESSEQIPRLKPLTERGITFLARNQNRDGGWGDTDRSLSNIATTMLVRAAFHLGGRADEHRELLARAERYIEAQGGIAGLRRRYGRDKTFVVPILTNCALAGLVPWREVSPLPFELACLPQATFRFLRLPVVSYAIPALVAIGQARYFHRKPLNPLMRFVRRSAVGRSLKTAERMQPDSGGFLEATPLTSFVVMSLAGSGRVKHPVVRRGVDFLVSSVRDDGSWPIDTNLATWVTTLAINALASAGQSVREFGCLDWLLCCQHREIHPFTGAAPGGWGWTDLSGAVPDADDTPGALLALAALKHGATESELRRIDAAADDGVQWLLGLQNRDGGWPTFCRGWGKLPFDRSGVDLTAHVLRALGAWKSLSRPQSAEAISRGLDFLARSQRPDGSWLPLWFGSQFQPDEENPVYGTARVLLAYRDLGLIESDPAQRGIAWLEAHQNPDGGWGDCPPELASSAAQVSTVEETSVALEALFSERAAAPIDSVLSGGLEWLVESVESGRYVNASPIGFYFAKLWYYEKLYPLIFTVAALGQALRCLSVKSSPLTSRHEHP
jgi:squalene-hopene/tetraprenyl-beta-curcumene cyclase